MNSYIEIIKELNVLEPSYDHTWLGSDPDRAFLICLGAGPWKVDRRRKVQQDALNWLGEKRLDEMHYGHFLFDVYPFKWQNNMLLNMLLSLRSNVSTFEEFCIKWKKMHWVDSLKDFFYKCGTKENGTKVLWMFARDYLHLPAFPIDRWVKRSLERFGLPCDSWTMTNLCIEAGVNPNRLNRALFSGANPDFSENWNE